MHDPDPQRSSLPDWAVAVLVTEGAALLIAVATTFIPGRTGRTWSPADALFENPSSLARVAGSFVLVNLLLVVIGVVAWILVRRDRSE